MNCRRLRRFVLTTLLCGLAAGMVCSPCQAQTNLSVWAFPGAGGRLLRAADPLGNRMLDYSAAGYRNGMKAIPDVPVRLTISPVEGDDGANIQGAIDTVEALPLDANGFRGAVYLTAGEYDVAGTLSIQASGVVLRGAGDGTNGTILRASGAGQRTLLTVAGAGSPSTISGSTHNITNLYVPVGACAFDVDSTAKLSVGSRVFVRRLANDAWIHDMGMDLLCCPPDVNPWVASSYYIDSDRVITRIEGSRVMLDAPITCAIDQNYGGGTIRAYTWSGRITNCGVEYIRGVSDYVSSDDEDHAWTFVRFSNVEHAWARKLTSRYFGYACVSLSGGSRCVTVTDCSSLDPVSIITGSRRYAFVMDDAQLCLVQNCYTSKDRHQYVTQSLTTGPNVFVDCSSDSAYSDAGPHHRWGTGAIWDNVKVFGNNLDVQNRGNSGSGHGWAGGNEVVWNCRANAFIVQNPPTARNWLIGSQGTIQAGTMYVGPHDPGTYDSHGTNVFPNSLYYAQLQDRLAASRVETRQYMAGEINSFAAVSSTGTVVAVDSAWRTQVQALAGSAVLRGFDIVSNDQFVPFTFNFGLSASERVSGATLLLATRSFSGTQDASLYLDATNDPVPLSTFGGATSGTNTVVRVVDLPAYLARLSDGRLNVAVSRDVGLDWAMLELQVTPSQAFRTNAISVAADAFVRGGVNASLNYGTDATLDIKTDSTTDNQRRAYLRWNLAGYLPQLQHARLRLTPVSAGTNGIENALALASTNAWTESTVNWNTQPDAGNRFATWIPAPGEPVEIAVTTQVQQALAGDGRLTFELLSLKNAGGPGLVSYASREDPDPSKRPQLLLVYSNTLPLISSLPDQSIPSSTGHEALPFTIGDPAYDVSVLTVGAVASNPTLVPASGIALEGSLSNRSISVTPAYGLSGTALITVVVTNPAGMTAGSSYTLTVTNGSAIVEPATGWWLADRSGDWASPANWSGGIVATGKDMTANFAVEITSQRRVRNNLGGTIGNLAFSDLNPDSPGAWMIDERELTLQVSSGTPVVSVQNATAEIRTVLSGTQGLNKTGAGTLVLSGTNAFTGPAVITTGSLRADNAQAFGSAAYGTTIGNDPSAKLELSANVNLLEPFTVSCKQSAAGEVPAILNSAGTNTLAGVLSLTTGGSYWTLESAAGLLRITGSITNITTPNDRTLWLRGSGAGEIQAPIGDSAGGYATIIRKTDPGLWVLSGQNTYSGNTFVSNGTLVVNGTAHGGVFHVSGVLAGTGTIKAPVSLYGTLSPGEGIGTLTISNNLTLFPGSVTTVDISAQSLACDSVAGISNLVYGGTLAVSNLAGDLLPGQSFRIFSARNWSGGFAGIVPASPGPNRAWAFDPSSGVLSVVALPPPVVTQFGISSGKFFFSGSGPGGQPYRVLSATNPALPILDWSLAGTGIFSGGVFSFSDPDGATGPQRFYRIGTP